MVRDGTILLSYLDLVPLNLPGRILIFTVRISLPTSSVYVIHLDGSSTLILLLNLLVKMFPERLNIKNYTDALLSRLFNISKNRILHSKHFF